MADDPRRKLELIYARNEIESKKSLKQFLLRSVIDYRPDPVAFETVVEPWQVAALDRLVPIIETVTGHRNDYTGPMLAWEGMPKGHNKSSGLASLLSGALAFSKKKGLRFYCAAKDAEQANLIRDFMIKLADLNPWYRDKLDFKNKFVVGKDSGSMLEILAADASGAQGKNPDCIILDETSVWGSKGRDLWNALFTSVGKRVVHGKMYCACIVLTNAGYKKSWQENLRNEAEKNPMWSFFESPPGRMLATWMTPEVIAMLRKEVSPIEAVRLFDNRWVDLDEERGAFDKGDVADCIGNPLPVAASGTAIISVDYGGVRDRTALTVVWYDGNKYHVVDQRAWQGSPEREIQVAEVGKWIDQQLRKYKKALVVLDIHQLLEQAQRLEAQGVNVVRFQYEGGRANVSMLQHLRTIISNRKLVFAADAGYLNGETLRDELETVITKTLSLGERLDHHSGLHDDRTVTLGMGCLEAVKHPPTSPISFGNSTSQQHIQQSGDRSAFSQDHLARRGLFGC